MKFNHVMPKMQPIVTDAVYVRQSVGHGAELGFTEQNRLNGSRSCLGSALLKFCKHIEGWGSNENYQKVGHVGSRVGHVTYF